MTHLSQCPGCLPSGGNKMQMWGMKQKIMESNGGGRGHRRTEGPAGALPAGGVFSLPAREP